MNTKKNAIVIGAGIVGLATARALALKKYNVTIFERNPRAIGASVRNFGMVWPIGQPKGKLLDQAMRSRSVWEEICNEADIWYSKLGSLQLAYTNEERDVIEEFYDLNFYDRDIDILNRNKIINRFNGIMYNGLKGGIFSSSEIIVDPREALYKIPSLLGEKYKVKFHFNTCINQIEDNKVYSGKKYWEADKIFICSGQDFETLYPEVFTKSGLIKCKLQMMRTIPQGDQWQIGASVAGGLTLTHYKAFEECKSLPALKKRIETEMSEYVRYGIHVMVSQNSSYEFTIGDTHEYGLDLSPFDKSYLNELVLKYLRSFVKIKDMQIAETWNGIYAKTLNKTEYIHHPSDIVTIINGLGGAGMTLSFGLAEKIALKL